MNTTNESTSNFYKYIFTDLADPRTNSWPFISDPILPLSIIIFYLYFVNSLGPRLMENRKPFKMKQLLIMYNFLQVLASLWLFSEAANGWFFHYNWTCEPVDFSLAPMAMRTARGVYIYFLNKMTELLDTVFFVLRKKNKQITFLHIYHHTVMPMITWGATKYYPGGHGTFLGLLNTFVHIVMYTYYLLAALGPEYQKFLWWKKYITRMQMAQFCLFFLHYNQLIFWDCGYPRWSVILISPNIVFFYLLFDDFYKNSYVKKMANGTNQEQSKANVEIEDKNGDTDRKKNGQIKHRSNSHIEQKANGNVCSKSVLKVD